MKRPLCTGLAVVLVLTLAEPGRSQTSFLGKSAAEWTSQLKDPKASVRRSAAFALGRLGRGSQHLSQLLDRVHRDEDASVRAMAATSIGDLITSMKDWAKGQWTTLGPTLLTQLSKEKEPAVRRGLCYALGTFGPEAVSAVPQLQKLLGDEDSTVCQNAAWALGRIGVAAGKGVVEPLCTLLNSSHALVRRDAATALGDIGLPTAIEAVKPMLDLVARESDQVKGDPVVLKTALDKLTRLAGDSHRSLTQGLYPLLENEDPETAQAAAFVLSNIYQITNEDVARFNQTQKLPLSLADARPILKVLIAALKDDEPETQEKAAASLGQLGPVAEEAVPALAAALSAPSVQLRVQAAVALSRMGSAAKGALPELIQALKPDQSDKNTPQEPKVRLFAAEAIGSIGSPANEAAIPTVVDIVRADSSQDVRHRCAEVFFRVTDLRKHKADVVLAQVLQDGDKEPLLLRYTAARILALHLKGDSPDTVPTTLLHMLGNKNLKLYLGAQARVEGAGSETSKGQTNIDQRLGGDARFLAAESLGWLGKMVANNKDVLKGLEAAAADKDDVLSKTAKEALTAIHADK